MTSTAAPGEPVSVVTDRSGPELNDLEARLRDQGGVALCRARRCGCGSIGVPRGLAVRDALPETRAAQIVGDDQLGGIEALEHAQHPARPQQRGDPGERRGLVVQVVQRLRRPDEVERAEGGEVAVEVDRARTSTRDARPASSTRLCAATRIAGEPSSARMAAAGNATASAHASTPGPHPRSASTTDIVATGVEGRRSAFDRLSRERPGRFALRLDHRARCARRRRRRDRAGNRVRAHGCVTWASR